MYIFMIYEDSVRDRGTKGETWQNGKSLKWGLLLCAYACFVLSADILKTQACNSYDSINACFRVSNALSHFGLRGWLVISVNIPLNLHRPFSIPSRHHSLSAPSSHTQVNHNNNPLLPHPLFLFFFHHDIYMMMLHHHIIPLLRNPLLLLQTSSALLFAVKCQCFLIYYYYSILAQLTQSYAFKSTRWINMWAIKSFMNFENDWSGKSLYLSVSDFLSLFGYQIGNLFSIHTFTFYMHLLGMVFSFLLIQCTLF